MKRVYLILLLIPLTLPAFSQKDEIAGKNEFWKDGKRVVIRNMQSLNTAHLEFSPAFYQNGIVYVTSRVQAGQRDKNIGETFFELFYAETGREGFQFKPKKFSSQINSHLHEGPASFNSNYTVMYFTRNNLKKGIQQADKTNVTRLKVYRAKRGPFDWEEIEDLPFNDDSYSCAHPSFSPDGGRLFFASDMPGGYGGMDLYVVGISGKAWTDPVNLGPEINTENNEIFPFIHPSGTLFFASDGHKGLGGLDLFLVDLKKGTEVRNLGEPFNSPADDLGIILGPQSKQGYFASAREGGMGKDDIYFFETDPEIWGEPPATDFQADILVLDSGTGEPVEGVSLRVLTKTEGGFMDGDNRLYRSVLMPAGEQSGELIFRVTTKDALQKSRPDLLTDNYGAGKFTFELGTQYMLLFSKEGYQTSEFLYSVAGIPDNNELMVQLDPSYCAVVAGRVIDKENGNPVPEAIVRIQSPCLDEEEILFSDADGNFEYCYPKECDFTVKGFKEYYEEVSVSLQVGIGEDDFPSELKLTLTPSGYTELDIPVLKEGAVIVLENIYYDFNKSAIRAGDAQELEELAGIMLEYPSMKIELESHTDSRGTKRYNRQLSIRRSESAKEFLVARGVDPDRIKTTGRGESDLRNHCSDGVRCTEIEHQYNRRTEVKVTKIDAPVEIKYN